MARPQAGDPAPDFELEATGGGRVRLSALRGRPVVLYFYPRDHTPGCTSEAEQFRDLHPEFERAGAVILGVSRDGIRSHERFRAKLGLPFPLLSDPDEAACTAYDVIRDKTLYGRKVRGIERSTFLIDAAGTIRRVWRRVRVAGHAAEVLEAVRAL
ncbi:peroxiredoxin [Inmirania thermothiophila]|uniref:thioredoxin-dependent peroxiredoxin n=1 Tax=Inmirania thermothiophila TaxID=1750597 RepID=A0A3N1XT58_9GAMM|nr:peroxiredoxin [Inmirania thermothiophila]ROR29819.1 peroxiredoxin Q/BCP [Inmirania thermothiophila]